MNRNYSLQLTAKASYKGQDFEFTFDPYGDCTSFEELVELAKTEIEDNYDREEDEEIDETEITVTITDYDEVPSGYANEDDVWEFAEAFAECEQEIDVVEAALDCDVSPKDIDEAYQGSYDDDEDFAQETADQLGAVDKNAAWPMTCIDWEQAAKELMYDYNESNGHYFRCL